MVTGMEFIIGADHAGWDMSINIALYLKECTRSKTVCMNEKLQEEIPYVPIANRVCKEALKRNATGILVCGTGIGMCIAANRIPSIRASILYSNKVAEYAKKHNNANVLIFGARTMEINEVYERLGIFLSNEYLGGKYEKRNKVLEGN